jgi:hypothetical protein
MMTRKMTLLFHRHYDDEEKIDDDEEKDSGEIDDVEKNRR